MEGRQTPENSPLPPFFLGLCLFSLRICQSVRSLPFIYRRGGGMEKGEKWSKPTNMSAAGHLGRSPPFLNLVPQCPASDSHSMPASHAGGLWNYLGRLFLFTGVISSRVEPWWRGGAASPFSPRCTHDLADIPGSTLLGAELFLVEVVGDS